MTRITIMALGSRGDVLPCAVLGQALQQSGHQVGIATFEGFRGMIESHGLLLHPVAGDARSILASGGGIALSESGQSVWRMLSGLRKSFVREAEAFGRGFAAPELRRSELIICQLPAGLYGYDLAELLDIPLILAAVMPLTRTRAFPMLAFPGRLAGLPGYNGATYRLAEQLVWQMFRGSINRWRQEQLGLGKLPLLGAAADLYREKVPVIHGFSRHVVERPPDWGENVSLTGYWFKDDGEWRPPEALLRFIESGPPPVFVGFGSMPMRDSGSTMKMIIDGLRLSGQRGILHRGWTDAGDGDLPESVHMIDYAPYEWLLPKMGAVVHHGGSGSTGRALEAGVPSLVTPFLFDQFYWGRQVARLEAGPRPIPFRRLTAANLAQAIGDMVSDDRMGAKSAALGRLIRSESGLAKGVELVEAQLAGRTAK